MDVIAVRIEPEKLAQLTRGVDGHIELVSNADGCYTAVIVPVSPTRSPDDRPKKNFSTLAEQRADERKSRGPVDPANLPVIPWVKYPNTCPSCGCPVPRGSKARWNPDLPGKPLYCNVCEPLPAN